MKRHYFLIFLLLVIVLKMMAQEKMAHTDRDKLKNVNLNSIFKKPVYDPHVHEYSVQELFPAMKLGEKDIQIVFDSLQKSGTLKMENDTKGFALSIELKFPALYNSPKNTSSIYNLNNTGLNKTMKLTLFESQLYNSVNQKLKVKSSSFTNFGRRIPRTTTEKVRKHQVDPNYISMSNPISDSIKADSLYTGSATYKIKIITGYDSIRCTKRDISKIIKLSGATYQLVTVFDNKVVLDILQDKGNSIELGVVSFDSIGKSFIHHAKFSDFLYAQSDSVAHVRTSIISKRSYDLIKSNPTMTIAEYKKRMSDHPSNQKQQNYVILETDTPLTHDFLIYSPTYGFDKLLELKLKH